MGSNREIKSDGNVIIKGLTYPSADGTAGQVLKTNGSGTLSFVDQASGSGVDTVASASEASSYSGTNRIIHITAGENVIFSSALADRIIINETANETNFYANLTNCTVNTKGNIEIRNASTDGSTDIDILNCKLMCDTLTVNNSGNTSGNQTNLLESSIHARNITFSTQATSDGYYFNKCNVFASGTLTMPPSGGGNLNIWYSNLSLNEITGFTNLNATFPSVVDVIKGSTGTTQIQIGGTDHLTSAYGYPFTVNKNGIHSKQFLIATTDAGQSISNASSTTVVYEDETEDTSGSYNTSTGVFTAQIKGPYQINAQVLFVSATGFDTGEILYIQIFLNGSLHLTGSLTEAIISNSQMVHYGSQISALVNCNIGDEIEIKVYQAAGHNVALLDQGDDNHLSIYKIN